MRHTRCALVTGVQTCALPISASPEALAGISKECTNHANPDDHRLFAVAVVHDRRGGGGRQTANDLLQEPAMRLLRGTCRAFAAERRSEESRVGNESDCQCRYRWTP